MRKIFNYLVNFIVFTLPG
jgi:hypothetical protein